MVILIGVGQYGVILGGSTLFSFFSWEFLKGMVICFDTLPGEDFLVGR